jgi:hypothetical protein
MPGASMKGLAMDISTGAARAIDAKSSHELRFASMHHAGRGLVIPCDAAGQVDMDALTERLRNAYLGARALIGREYLFPSVELAH